MKKLSPFIVLAISLVFTVSCVNKEVQVTETYYETEYKAETYVEIGKEQRAYLIPNWTRNAPTYFTILEWGTRGAESNYDGYEISTAKYSKSQARIILSPLSQASSWAILFVDLTGLGPIYEPPPQNALAFQKMVEGEMIYVPPPGEQQWLDDLNAITRDPSRCLSFTRSEEYTDRDITVDVTGVEQFVVITCVPWDAGRVVEKVQLIWSEEVTREKLVPYHVEKQRTVMQTKKVPFWEAIFNK